VCFGSDLHQEIRQLAAISYYIDCGSYNLFVSEPQDFWVGVEYDLDTKKWQTIETKVELQGLERPDACLYPGFVSTDYKPKEVEQCLLMTGTAWQSTPCKREDGISAICEYGKLFHDKQYQAANAGLKYCYC
jgi:hypothetical protein